MVEPLLLGDIISLNCNLTALLNPTNSRYPPLKPHLQNKINEMFFKESENISYKNPHVIRYLPCVRTCMSFGIYPAFAYRFAPI